MNNLSKFIVDKTMLIIAFLAVVVLSISAWYTSYQTGLAITYNDSMSHLNISRLVIDNLKPGFSQLGGVWLPVPHILPLLFIWNDWAWHSGFAASIFSMLSYIFSVWGLYHIVKQLTGRILPSLIGAAVFALNLNMLYIQTTPLTEGLYVCFLVLSGLAFVRYISRDNPKYLLILGVLGFLQVLTRYDGWFVVGCEGLLIISYELFLKKRSFAESLSKTVLFAFPVAFGMFLWLLWNVLIFNDMFYFALGPFSAHSQQSNLEDKAGLITKNSIPYSFLAYWYSMTGNIGWIMLLIGILGAIYYLFRKNMLGVQKKLLVILFLFAPIIFNILALYLGFSIINIPELNWNRSSEISGQWFNVRYGIIALPFVAVFVGILASYKRLIAGFLFLLIIFQSYLLYQNGLITVIDGTIGSSSFDNYDIGEKLKAYVKPGEKVILSTSYFNSVAFVSDLDLQTIIHEGVSDVWSKALDNPQRYAEWVVTANGDTGESVFNHTLRDNKRRFLTYYKEYYKGEHAYLFKRKDVSELAVTREENTLFLADKKWESKGVNSYDLAYRTEDQIKDTFDNLEKSGVNTIRFWLFGDGTKDGFQPKPGEFNEARFKNVDLIFHLASMHNIKLIPVFVNNWEEYGGKNQYVAWIGKKADSEDLFYTDQAAKDLFKNYINYVLSRENSINKKIYRNDPAVLVWDIMNEPRGTDSVVRTWTQEIASYIKQKDQTHLVMIGTERLLSQTNENHATELCGLDVIDICSLHLYLYDKDTLLFDSKEKVSSFLAEQRKEAEKVEKPIFLGEWGVSKETRPYNQDPLITLKDVVSESHRQGYNGYFIWNYSALPDSSFGFSPKGQKSLFSITDLRSVLQN